MAATVDPTSVQPEKRATPPVQMFYCGVCTHPPEYCEFGDSLSKCKEWLQAQRPDLYEKYYSDEALQARRGTLSQAAQRRLEQESANREAKADAIADAARNKKLASHVVIKRRERNKRKFVTSVRGLDAFGVDLKKAAKLFAQEFATGSSVTKNAAGIVEIVLQGDVSHEIYDMIAEANEGSGDRKGGMKGLDVLKGVLIDNVEMAMEKRDKAFVKRKKKKASVKRKRRRVWLTRSVLRWTNRWRPLHGASRSQQRAMARTQCHIREELVNWPLSKKSVATCTFHEGSGGTHIRRIPTHIRRT